ncbi:MAG: SusC/RagA family TonB-linked outer membrane protein [Candidatus Azobacteroides sp.]|nr:SusC/RagA family TonB-linked outer membrane protein [Candidatus Azobacteroides sp.]
MKKFVILSAFFLFGWVWANAQTGSSGTVVDENGDPVIGASVLVKNTSVGTVTDVNGHFNINVPAGNHTLVVNYIGMISKEVAVGSNLKVVLQSSARDLDEVVVTAMGITREKKALGYAQQTVNSDELTQAANSSLAGALQGKTSGIDIKSSSGMPGASSQIIIRGARSFTESNTPLYVIDGMPVASTADLTSDYGEFGNGGVVGPDYANRGVDIDPNDIESISILKGQAAAALYGIRASNGVIVITTKSGKGLAKGKPQVTYNTNVGWDVISRYPDLQQTYAQGTYNSGRGQAVFAPVTSSSWGPKISDLPNDPTYGGNNNGHPGMYYVPQRENAGLDPWVRPQTYDNIKAFFNTGFTYNNSLNVSQATDNTTYSVSLGNTHQTGIIPTTGMDRYLGKIGAETKLDDHWKSGFIGTYINTSIKKMPTANDGVVATVYGAPVSYDLMGIPASYADDPYSQNAYRAISGFDYAPWLVQNEKFTEKTNRFYGNIYANYFTQLAENHKLNVKYQIGDDTYTTHYQDIWAYGHSGKTGEIQNTGVTKNVFNSLLTATYDWKINEDCSFNAILGNEVNQENFKYYRQYGKQYNFPGWNHLNNTVTQESDESQDSERTVGFFGSLSFDYKNMLYLNATGRQDYVSTMPRGHRSFFYPSVSLGFILTELDGLKGLDVLNYAKLRASYAHVGQAGNYYANFFVKPNYDGGLWADAPIVYPVNGVSAFTPYVVVYDRDMKPQNTKSYELGFDVNFFRNLITLSYTYSRQNVKDQIFDVPLAGSTGSWYLRTNGGKIHTNSHEITLTVNPVRTKNVDWSLGFNWSKVDNYVDELAPGVESIYLGGFVIPQVRAGIGDKFPVIYGASYLRDNKGRIVVDEDGLPMAGEDKVIGSVSPDFILGANTTLKLFKFTLNAVFEWKQGGHMYGGTAQMLDYYGVGKNTENRETPLIVNGVKNIGTDENPEYVTNDIVVQGANAHQKYYTRINDIDESFIFKNSFIKMRELSVSYPVFKRSWLELTASAFARNILIWTNYPYLDPESSQGNDNMSGAFERFSLPQTSSYGLGLTVKF